MLSVFWYVALVDVNTAVSVRNGAPPTNTCVMTDAIDALSLAVIVTWSDDRTFTESTVEPVLRTVWMVTVTVGRMRSPEVLVSCVVSHEASAAPRTAALTMRARVRVLLMVCPLRGRSLIPISRINGAGSAGERLRLHRARAG
jgi:hypothetical protein